MKSITQGAVCVLQTEGPLLAEQGQELVECAAPDRFSGRAQVVVDLAGSPLVDSAGCEALLDARDAVTESGGEIVLTGACPLMHEILVATGVAEGFRICSGVQEAVAHFAR